MRALCSDRATRLRSGQPRRERHLTTTATSEAKRPPRPLPPPCPHRPLAGERTARSIEVLDRHPRSAREARRGPVRQSSAFERQRYGVASERTMVGSRPNTAALPGPEALAIAPVGSADPARTILDVLSGDPVESGPHRSGSDPGRDRGAEQRRDEATPGIAQVTDSCASSEPSTSRSAGGPRHPALLRRSLDRAMIKPPARRTTSEAEYGPVRRLTSSSSTSPHITPFAFADGLARPDGHSVLPA